MSTIIPNPVSLQDSGKFWTFDVEGNKILRDLEAEHTEKDFNFGKYCSREDGIDDINYLYYENFRFEIYDAIGSDYERYGSIIEEGDVVLDIGANIGAFSRRAIQRGASKVYAFEPMSRAFSCLLDNVDPRVSCFKIAISDKEGLASIKTNFSSGIGGSSLLSTDESFLEELIITQSLENLFQIGILPEKIDFCKMDCEGSEKMIFESWQDETILRFRKFSIEYHQSILGSELRESTTERLSGLGYNNFTLTHASGDLVTIHYWK
jgi:FkbM family methyltransferase